MGDAETKKNNYGNIDKKEFFDRLLKLNKKSKEDYNFVIRMIKKIREIEY